MSSAAVELSSTMACSPSSSSTPNLAMQSASVSFSPTVTTVAIPPSSSSSPSALPPNMDKANAEENAAQKRKSLFGADLNAFTYDCALVCAVGSDEKVKRSEGLMVPEKLHFELQRQLLVRFLKSAGLEVSSFLSTSKKEVYIMIGASEARLRKEAERTEYELQMDTDCLMEAGQIDGIGLCQKMQVVRGKSNDPATTAHPPPPSSNASSSSSSSSSVTSSATTTTTPAPTLAASSVASESSSSTSSSSSAPTTSTASSILSGFRNLMPMFGAIPLADVLKPKVEETPEEKERKEKWIAEQMKKAIELCTNLGLDMKGKELEDMARKIVEARMQGFATRKEQREADNAKELVLLRKRAASDFPYYAHYMNLNPDSEIQRERGISTTIHNRTLTAITDVMTTDCRNKLHELEQKRGEHTRSATQDDCTSKQQGGERVRSATQTSTAAATAVSAESSEETRKRAESGESVLTPEEKEQLWRRPRETLKKEGEEDEPNTVPPTDYHPNSLFTSLDRIRLTRQIIEAERNVGGAGIAIDRCILGKETRFPNVIDFVLFHDTIVKKRLLKKWTPLANGFTQPLNDVRAYFGEKIAMYFAFLSFFCKWIWPIAIIGAILFLWQYIAHTPDVAGLPIFSVVVAIWGTVFLEFWKRRQARYVAEWGMSRFTVIEQQRPEYEGQPVIDDTNGRRTKYFEPKVKRRRMCVGWSIMITLVMLVVAGVVGILAFRKILVAWDETWGSYITAAMNFVLIQVMNFVADILARKLNDWENYEKPSEYESALIAKKFLFAFVNSYNSLFYIAFIKKYDMGCTNDDCLGELRIQLGTIFVMSLVVNNAQELFTPLFMAWWRACSCGGCGKKPTTHVSERTPQPELERAQEPYADSTMNDFLEIVILFGYVSMFVVVFPLAPLLALVNFFVEMRLDAHKLVNELRRPFPFGAASIGVWYDIMNAVSFISVVTNTLLCALESGFLETFTDDLFTKILIFIIAEHVIVLVKFFTAFYIPDIPDEVKSHLARQEFLTEALIHGIKHDHEDESEVMKGGKMPWNLTEHEKTGKIARVGRNGRGGGRFDPTLPDTYPNVNMLRLVLGSRESMINAWEKTMLGETVAPKHSTPTPPLPAAAAESKSSSTRRRISACMTIPATSAAVYLSASTSAAISSNPTACNVSPSAPAAYPVEGIPDPQSVLMATPATAPPTSTRKSKSGYTVVDVTNLRQNNSKQE